MNASCALQHFCDLHGPQILLCTEAKIFIRTIENFDNENLKTFYSQYVKSANVECKSCTLSSDALLISTMDFVNHLLFISSASTPNQELFKNTRNACVRSLNVEKSAENDHPVLFGDDENGYCLSLTFSCKDFQSRGCQRLYSLSYLSSDKIHLLSLMTLIRQCFRQIVFWLQNDANEIYQNEGQIRVNTNFNGTTSKATFVLRAPPRNPTQRTLSSVVGDPNLIYRIHSLFVWILRLTNSAMNETMFEALPTEDNNQRKTQQNFSSDDDDDEDDFDSLEFQFSSHGSVGLKLFRQFIYKLNHFEHLELILFHWVIGNQLILKFTNPIEDKDLIRALVSVFRLVLPDGCFHLLEGNLSNSQTIYSANFILLDTELMPSELHQIEKNFDTNSIIIRVIFDDIDHQLHFVQLERLHLIKREKQIPIYVKRLIEILLDETLDDQAFEAMVTHEKLRYLNKAKIYFQLGRCRKVTHSTLSERKLMNLIGVEQSTDLSMIRFWQKGLSQTYKNQIRLLKHNENVCSTNVH